MSAEFVFMDANACPHCANIINECFKSKDITHMEWLAFSLDLNPIKRMWASLADQLQPINRLQHVHWNFEKDCLLSGVILPKISLILSMPRHHMDCISSYGRQTMY
ncbi:DDE_3 domain-containing protein [Trichonephila clavipes]|nr:DDE_3 domain-containing protein [Trichonephila clavipes]